MENKKKVHLYALLKGLTYQTQRRGKAVLGNILWEDNTFQCVYIYTNCTTLIQIIFVMS